MTVKGPHTPSRRGTAVLLAILAVSPIHPFFAVAKDGLSGNDTSPFYRRRPAIIQRTDEAQLQALLRAGLILDPIRPETIRAYLTRKEFAWVDDRGWQVDWVPDEGLPYWSETKGVAVPFTIPLNFYPTYAQLTSDLQILAASYPDLCRLQSIGKSVQGRDLWFMKITDNPDTEEDEPEFKYIGTMHGNEPVGMIMLINLIHHLLEGYSTTPRLRNLIDHTEIWIMPLMNPDGYSANPRSRFNGGGSDLNRNFPDPLFDNNNSPAGREPETQAVMNFGFTHSSVLSANMHTGALVVNYPFDYHLPASPDDDLFIEVSRVYADHNPPMSVNNTSPFDNGIVRGAVWFIIHGGMQDWNYLWLGCNEVTLELSNTFQPAATALPGFWEDNRESMLSYMEQVHIGIHGLVTDAVSGLPLPATVTVTGRDHEVFTDPDVGDYHRMLPAGAYDLVFEAAGYRTRTATGVVVASTSATLLNMALEPVAIPTATPSPTFTATPTPTRKAFSYWLAR